MCRHATCYNTVGSFTCQCNVGFFDIEENGNCLDVDECLSGVAICPRESECKNTIGSYDCPCIAGHELKTDEISDQEEASRRIFNLYFDFQGPSARALNETWFYCGDIDECKNESHSCDTELENCVNTEGTYQCFCKIGYRKDQG